MILSKRDLVVTLELIESCRRLSSREDVENIFELLREHVGVGALLAGYNDCITPGGLDGSSTLFLGVPSEWQELYTARRYFNVDPVVKLAFECDAAVRWSDSFARAGQDVPDEFLSLCNDFGLREGMACGTRSHTLTGAATITSVSLDSDDISPPQLIMLQHILPHLNDALACTASWHSPKLTARELEVLKWARIGKSYWETGKIMGISERTVKFHLNNVYRKLNVVNKTQAIARAYTLGCLSA